MKTLLGYIAAFVLLTVAGCGHSYPPSLRLADSLMDSRPDSALAVLDAVREQAAGAPEAVRMRYQLLRHQAMNKAYVPFTTDSVMLAVADYYDRHGTANDRLLAHYLLGCVYRDLGEAPQALRCFQDAVELADTTNREQLRILMKIYSQMAELYHAQNLPQDEINCRLSNQRYAFMLGDTLSYIRHSELMIKPYFLLGDTSNIILTLEKTRQLYLEHNAPDKAAATCNTLIDFYSSLGRLQEARQLMDEFEQKSGLFDNNGRIEKGREIYYYIKGNYFLHLHQLDSAEHYFRRLQCECRSLNDTLGIYKGLMELYQQRRSTDSIVYYSHLYASALDRQSRSRQTETLHRMAKLYSYSRLQRQADLDARRASHTQLVAALLTLGIVALLFLLYFLYRQHRQFKESQLAELARLNNACRRAEDALAIAELEIKNAKRESTEQIAEKTQQIDKLRNQLERYIERYLAVKPSDRELLMAKSDIVSLFQEKSNWTRDTQLPDLAQWRELLAQFKLNLPTLYSAIGQGEKLSVQELRACVLLLLNFSEADAGVLIGVSPQRITNIKSRVNQKLFGDTSALTLISNIRRRATML